MFALAGCGSEPNIWGDSLSPAPAVTSIYYQTETPVATIAPTETVSPTETIVPTDTPVPTATITPTPSFASINRVVIISYDGMRPDAIPLAPMPNLMNLAANGAS